MPVSGRWATVAALQLLVIWGFVIEASYDIISQGIEASGLLSKYLLIVELRFDEILRKYGWGPYQMFTLAAFGPRAAGSPPLLYGFKAVFVNFFSVLGLFQAILLISFIYFIYFCRGY